MAADFEREARNALLDAEIALRRQTEAAANLRRALPPGDHSQPSDQPAAPGSRTMDLADA